MTPNRSEDTGDVMPNLKPNNRIRIRRGYLLQENVSEGPR
jgi:hypothetical protein